MEKLKPCPFCGGRAYRVPHDIGGGVVRCGNCSARTVGTCNLDQAIAAWNHRPPETDTQDDLIYLDGILCKANQHAERIAELEAATSKREYITQCKKCGGYQLDIKTPFCRCEHPGIIGWTPTPDDTRRGS